MDSDLGVSSGTSGQQKQYLGDRFFLMLESVCMLDIQVLCYCRPAKEERLI